MAVDFPKTLMFDGTLNKVIAVYPIDSKEMLKNGPGRYSVVAWVPGSIPAGQRCSMQGGVDTYDLSHQVESATGGTVAR